MSFKKHLILICALLFANVILAQRPPIPLQRPTGAVTQGDNPYENTRLRGQRAPISPATLLLLGLGGATIGTRILINSKKK